ncbi:hypothetical protein ACGFZP_07030 [Kitasatospora sp. NPDC048239]|uniref:hypothetical protein n=1 Tax=Kitasatospora sp. NPDC048239 TaxID=3364046 RepID=UPI0037139695
MRTSGVLSAGLAAVAMVALAACGAAEKSPPPEVPAVPSITASPSEDTVALELAKKAREALLGSPSVTLLAEQPSRTANPGYRVSFDQQGNCVGESRVEHGSFLFRKVGEEGWSHPDRAWLEYDSDTRSHTPPEDREEVFALMSKWQPDDEAVLKEWRARCSAQFVADLIRSESPTTKTLKVARIATGTVGGTPVIVLRSAGLSGITKVSVAAEGTPYPLKVEFDSSGREPSGTFTLSGFGEPVPADRPQPGEIWVAPKNSGE